jgi:hypothetical protein
MKQKHTTFKGALQVLITCGFALGSLGVLAQEGFDDVIAVGPVDSVAPSGFDFSVLGRTFHADGAVAFAVGEYVAVHGSLQSDGSTTDVWVESFGAYVPGSNAVYEKGVVTEARPFLGQVRIGGSRLDYTPAISSSTGVDPSLGSVIAVSGLQPTSNGTVLVDNLMASADRVRDSLMKGGGVRSSLMKGGGVKSTLMKGGGVRSSLMKGGGVKSTLMKGGGVRSSLMKGGGTTGT